MKTFASSARNGAAFFARRFLFVVMLTLLALPLWSRAEGLFNVMSYGADPRGRELSTLAMQRAIDACTLSGGGTVVVPPGRYRIATITIKNNVTLQFEKETFVDAPRLYSQYSPYNSLFRQLLIPILKSLGQASLN